MANAAQRKKLAERMAKTAIPQDAPETDAEMEKTIDTPAKAKKNGKKKNGTKKTGNGAPKVTDEGIAEIKRAAALEEVGRENDNLAKTVAQFLPKRATAAAKQKDAEETTSAPEPKLAGSVYEGIAAWPAEAAERYAALPGAAALLLTQADALRLALPRMKWNKAQQKLEREALKMAQALAFCGYEVQRAGVERLGARKGRTDLNDPEIQQVFTDADRFRQIDRAKRTHAQQTVINRADRIRRAAAKRDGSYVPKPKGGVAKGVNGKSVKVWIPENIAAAEECATVDCTERPELRVVNPIGREHSDHCRRHALRLLTDLRNDRGAAVYIVNLPKEQA